MTTISGERDILIDPVSHEEVDVKHSGGSSFYCGHRYFFIDWVNKRTFDENPQLWIPTPHGSLTSAALSHVEDE
jgi:YHS domain-containing protein